MTQQRGKWRMNNSTKQAFEAANFPDGYRPTELGPLPEEWRVVRLGEVADLTMGQSPPSLTYNTHGEGLPFLQGKAEFGEIYPQPIKWCSAPLRVAKRGSVLISVRAPVGDVNLALRDYCIGRGLAALSGREALNNDFLFYFLINAKPQLEEQGTGSTFKSINRSVLQSFPLPLPPLSEQRAIAHVLRAVQRAREATERVIAATRELKKSLMRHLFTYGPVPVDQADQVPMQETDIGPIPAHWQVVKLGEVCDLYSGFAFRSEDFTTKGIPVIKIGNLQNGIVIINNKDSHYPQELWNPSLMKYLLSPGDVLIALTGATTGKIAIVPQNLNVALLNQRVGKFSVVDSNKFDLTFGQYMFETSSFQKLIKQAILQSAQGNISPIKIKSFAIPLPPLSEQREIARILQAVDRKLEAEEARRQALEALFKTLLHQLMSGKLRVPVVLSESKEGPS
jgi:type I restriction enzyme S subunit